MRCRDDDHPPVPQGLSKLLRVDVDAGDNAPDRFVVVDRVSQLVVNNLAVAYHDHTVVDLLACPVGQSRQAMSQPADAVRLAASCRVLDQIVASGALSAGGLHECVNSIQLVVTGEDDRPVGLDAGAPGAVHLPFAFLDEHV